MESTEKLRMLMKAASDETQGVAGPCPSESALIGYHLSRVDPESAERTASHVAACRRCRTTLADAAVFFESRARQEKPVDLKAEWAKLEKSLCLHRHRPSWATPFLAVAASLLAGAGLTFWWAMNQKHKLDAENLDLRAQVAAVRNELASVNQPQANVPILDIFPTGNLERSAGAGFVNQLLVDQAAASAWVITAEERREFPAYSIEIFEQTGGIAGRSRWRTESLTRDAHRNFVITLPGGFLENGFYVIRLSGREGNSWRQLSEYKVELRPSAGRSRE